MNSFITVTIRATAYKFGDNISSWYIQLNFVLEFLHAYFCLCQLEKMNFKSYNNNGNCFYLYNSFLNLYCRYIQMCIGMLYIYILYVYSINFLFIFIIYFISYIQIWTTVLLCILFATLISNIALPYFLFHLPLSHSLPASHSFSFSRLYFIKNNYRNVCGIFAYHAPVHLTCLPSPYPALQNTNAKCSLCCENLAACVCFVLISTSEWVVGVLQWSVV